MASKNEKKQIKKLVKKEEKKDANYSGFKFNKLARYPPRPKRKPSTKVMSPGSTQAKGTAYPPAGGGPSTLTSTTAENIAQEQYNHAMSLLNPSMREYNWAPAAQAVGAPTIVYRTIEVVTAGCPGVNDAAGALGMANMGMGAVICRPNALFDHWMFTSGQDTMGYEVSDDRNAPALCVMNPTEGSQAGSSFFTLNFSGALGPNFIADKGTSQPDWYAAAQAPLIQDQGSLFRCTSASLEVSYIGPTMLGSGIIVAAPIPRDALIGFTGESDQVGGVYTAPGFSFDQLLKLYNSFNGPAIQGAHIKYLPYDDKAFEMKPTVFQYEGFVVAADSLPKEQRLRVTCLSPLRGKNTVKEAFHHVIKNKSPTTIRYNTDVIEKGKPPKAVFSFEESSSVDAVLDYFSCVRWLSDPKNTSLISARSPEALERVCTFIKASRHLDAPPGDILPSLDYFGSSGSVPQPCDITVDAMESASALSASWAGTGLTDLNTYVDTFLQAKANIDWSYSEPLLCIAWQGCTIDTDSMPASYTGQQFEVTKYVNYEIVFTENTLSAATNGNTTVGMVSSATAAPSIQIAGLVQPSGKGSAKPSLGSSLTGALNKGLDFTGKVAGGLGKAAEVAETIGSILAAFA